MAIPDIDKIWSEAESFGYRKGCFHGWIVGVITGSVILFITLVLL